MTDTHPQSSLPPSADVRAAKGGKAPVGDEATSIDTSFAQAAVEQSVGAAEMLRRHLDRKCGCSRHTNPNNCLYQMFPDGWDFTPAVGNEQERGEVFTPRPCVDLMLVGSGMLSPEAVYAGDYESAEDDEAERLVDMRVYEPAVGTANFLSTVLWHKLGYAFRLAGGNPKRFDLELYEHLVLRAVASIYANDIDPGNLQTAMWRIMRDEEAIFTATAVSYWTGVMTAAAAPIIRARAAEFGVKELTRAEEKFARESFRTYAQRSLAEAQRNWSCVETDGGLIEQLYRQHTSTEIPKRLSLPTRKLLRANLQLFNSLVEEHDGLIPGYGEITWTAWKIAGLKPRVVSTSRHVDYMPGRPKNLKAHQQDSMPADFGIQLQIGFE